MLWQTDGPVISTEFLGTLIPERVLFEYEGPRTFLARDNVGELLFAHQCGETESNWRYAVVPFSDRLVEELEQGRLDLRSALDQPRFWLVDIGAGWKLDRCVRSSLKAIPETCLPQAGIMLYPEFEPLLAVRFKGRPVEVGQATLGLLRGALDNVRESLKTLATFATGEVSKRGQPSAKTRKYYDLPALLLGGSIRVVVLPERDPQKQLFELDNVWQRMESLLQRGLEEVAKSPGEDQASVDSDPELLVALRAVYLLSPPANGPVEATEISGRLALHNDGGKPVTLNKNIRVSLGKRLRLERENQPRVIDEEGYITELDKEEATCKLRDAQGATIQRLSFEEKFFEEIKAAFDSDRRVRVIAELPPPFEIADVVSLTFID